jgi:RNA polymerase sigma-70 factor (ECF subfamily)
MHTTRVSLLEGLRQSSAGAAWERFVRLYTPLLLHWARKLGLSEHDAADLVQDVMLVLIRKLPEFEYQSDRTFRGWMRTVLINKWRDRSHRSAPDQLDSAVKLAVPPDLDTIEDREYNLYIMGRALRLMEADFEPATWKACWETVVCGRSGAEVAAELGISVNAVYLAKKRVLSRLRHDLAGLLE